jgi:hypothetical protein
MALHSSNNTHKEARVTQFLKRMQTFKRQENNDRYLPTFVRIICRIAESELAIFAAKNSTLSHLFA